MSHGRRSEKSTHSSRQQAKKKRASAGETSEAAFALGVAESKTSPTEKHPYLTAIDTLLAKSFNPSKLAQALQQLPPLQLTYLLEYVVQQYHAPSTQMIFETLLKTPVMSKRHTLKTAEFHTGLRQRIDAGHAESITLLIIISHQLHQMMSDDALWYRTLNSRDKLTIQFFNQFRSVIEILCQFRSKPSREAEPETEVTAQDEVEAQTQTQTQAEAEAATKPEALTTLPSEHVPTSIPELTAIFETTIGISGVCRANFINTPELYHHPALPEVTDLLDHLFCGQDRSYLLKTIKLQQFNLALIMLYNNPWLLDFNLGITLVRSQHHGLITLAIDLISKLSASEKKAMSLEVENQLKQLSTVSTHLMQQHHFQFERLTSLPQFNQITRSTAALMELFFGLENNNPEFHAKIKPTWPLDSILHKAHNMIKRYRLFLGDPEPKPLKLLPNIQNQLFQLKSLEVSLSALVMQKIQTEFDQEKLKEPCNTEKMTELLTHLTQMEMIHTLRSYDPKPFFTSITPEERVAFLQTLLKQSAPALADAILSLFTQGKWDILVGSSSPDRYQVFVNALDDEWIAPLLNLDLEFISSGMIEHYDQVIAKIREAYETKQITQITPTEFALKLREFHHLQKEITRKLISAETAVHQATSEIQTLETRLADEQHMRFQVSADLKTTHTQIEKLQTHIQSLTQDLAQRESTVTQLRSDLSQREATVTQLRSELKTARADLRGLKAQLLEHAKHQKKLLDMQSELDSLKSHQAQIIAQHRQDIMTEARSTLEARLREAQNTLEASQKESKATLESIKGEHQKTLAQLRSELSSCQTQLSQLHHALEKMTREKDQATHQIEAHQKRIQAQSEEITTLAQKNQTLTDMSEASKTQLTTLSAELAQSQKSNAELSVEHEALIRKNAELTYWVGLMRHQFEDLQANYSALQKRHEVVLTHTGLAAGYPVVAPFMMVAPMEGPYRPQRQNSGHPRTFHSARTHQTKSQKVTSESPAPIS